MLRQNVLRVCGIHLHVIAPAGDAAPFEEMLQRWRTVGLSLSNLACLKSDTITYAFNCRFKLLRLETVINSTGNSVTYEEVFPNEKRDQQSMLDTASEKYRPTKSSVVRMEVSTVNCNIFIREVAQAGTQQMDRM